MGLKKKIIFAAFKDRFFRAGVVLPSSDCRWSLWEETKVDGCVSKTDLGWNINCSSKNRLCPSTVWIWFNNFASDLIRRATVSPLLRTLNFDLRVIVEESLYAIPGTALMSRVSGFFFSFLCIWLLSRDSSLIDIQRWGGSNHLHIPHPLCKHR